MHKLAVVGLLVAGVAHADADADGGAGTVSIGKVTVKGALDAKVAELPIVGARSQLNACFAQALGKNARLHGTIVTTVSIDAAGKVTEAKAKGIDPAIEKCVAAAYQKLTFAKPKDGKPATLTSTTTYLNPYFASITGTADLEGGFDDTAHLGGGGGTGEGTIGLGTIGTIGRGSGTGSGYGIGSGRGGMRGRSVSVPSISLGQPTAGSGLDPAIIRRYIKRNVAKIQYCYEKELLSKPNLGGTLLAEFAIGSDGRVTTSKATGVDPKVEQCIANVIQQIEFPKPTSELAVRYPFTFRPPVRKPPAPVGVGQPVAGTGLDKPIIRRYIKRNIGKIQYCYEKELLGKPDIQGTVTVEFTIGVQGKVTASKASGVDPAVEECLAKTIHAIEFPKPKGGELVVRYPFTFRPAQDTKPPAKK